MSRLTRLIGATLVVSSLAAGSLLVEDAGATKKQCRNGKIAWKIEGRLVCAKPPAKAKRPTAEAAFIGEVVEPAPVARIGPWRAVKERPMTPTSWRNTAALVTATAKGGVEQLEAGTPGPGRATVNPKEVVGTFSEPIAPRSVGDGVTVGGNLKASADSSGEITLGFEMTAEKGGFALDLKPSLTFGGGSAPRCPTADGELAWKDAAIASKNTAIARKGNKVIGAVTNESKLTSQVLGKVGPDARLSSVEVRHDVEFAHYERGLQLTGRVNLVSRIGRSGGSQPAGTPKVDVRIRASGASRAAEAAAEREVARTAAADLASKLGDQLAGSVVKIRDQLLDREPGWYDFGNPCVDADFAPRPSTAAEGETGTTVGSFKMKPSGQQPDATWKRVIQSAGQMTPPNASSGPGSRPSFKWTAGRPVGNTRETTYAQYVITSRAGRGQATFITRAPDVPDLEVEIDGTFTGENDVAKASVDTKTVIHAIPMEGDEPGTNWQARDPYYWDARSPSMYGKGGCSASLTSASGADYVTYPPAAVATKVTGGYLVYLFPIIRVIGDVYGGPCGSSKPWSVFPTTLTMPGLMLKVNGTGPTSFSESGLDPAGYPGSYDMTIRITELT